MTGPRPIEPTEAFALGSLHGILAQTIGITIDTTQGIDVNTRSLDVYGLVPRAPGTDPVCIRITIEEVA